MINYKRTTLQLHKVIKDGERGKVVERLAYYGRYTMGLLNWQDDGARRLEDLKVLMRSPDLLNNVEIGQSQLRHSYYTYFVIPCMCMVAILVKRPKTNKCIIFIVFYLLYMKFEFKQPNDV